MPTDTMEKLTWVLIYGGLIGICIGLFLQRQDAALGWTFMFAGGAGAAVGAVLVWVRSRRPD